MFRSAHTNQTLQNEPHRDKGNTMACAPSKDSDQPGHLRSLIRVFDVPSMESEKKSNDQELIQSDPISCPQNQKGNN